MKITNQYRRFSRLGAAAVSLVALGALTLPLTPANAQAWVQVGPLGIGVGAPAPYYYYGYPYRHYYYRHYYYGYNPYYPY